MEHGWGTTSPEQADRLAALRMPSATGSKAHKRTAPSRVVRETVLGAVLLVLGAVLVLVFVTRSTGHEQTVDGTAPTVAEPAVSEVEPGQALVAALLQQGSYPPELTAGDRVLVVVTAPLGEGTPARALQHPVTVAHVEPSESMGSGTVVTLAGPEALAREIADADSVHLSILPVAG